LDLFRKLQLKHIFTLILTFICSLSMAQSIQVIVPFAPGGGADTMYRVFEKYCAKRNIDLVPVYKPGAEGAIGLNVLANGDKTGKVLGVTPVMSVIDLQLKTDTEAVEMISLIGIPKMVLVASNKSQIKNFNDLEKNVRDNKKLNFGETGASQRELMRQVFNNLEIKETDNQIRVPYTSVSQLLSALLSNQIDVAFLTAQVALSQYEAGKVQIIASTGPLDEIGTTILPKKYNNWNNINGYGLAMPLGSNPESVKYWTQVMRDFLNDTESINELTNLKYDIPKHGKVPFKRIVDSGKKNL